MSAAVLQPLSLQDALKQGVAAIGQLPDDVSQWPFLLQLSEAFPITDLVFGGLMLIAVVLIHAAGIGFISGSFAKREKQLSDRAQPWRAHLLMVIAVASLLILHVAENVFWTVVLAETGLIPDWRAAGFFVGNTYTTIGYGTFLLPPKWEMLAPIIAISGLFTFGWSGSVLVDYVRRTRRLSEGTATPVNTPKA
ncbi:MAG: hypothetical protein JSR18_15620 [Proteobacteria bacterium]|nr:hypothetical protein [Pseudomonadota bacterium]